jgi:hypothetical protein
MRRLTLDPSPSDALDALWGRNETLADAIEEGLDWIEADPLDVRAKRRSFTNGMWVIGVRAGGEEWTIVWDEEVSGEPVVRLIAETTSI